MMTSNELIINAMHTILYAQRAVSKRNKISLLEDAVRVLEKAVDKTIEEEWVDE